MFYGFFKNHRTRTLLFAAGFLVIVLVVLSVSWVYFSFMVDHDDFFDVAPAGTAIFWHESPGRQADIAWLYDLSKRFLSGEAASRAEFLFDNVAPSSRETAFAVLPGFEDFIFWGKVDAREFGDLKTKLEDLDFNYIFEDSGKITITNTKPALKEVLAVLSRKNFSLADERGKLIAWNRATRHFPIQIYVASGLRFENFEGPVIKSDFWETNELKAGRRSGAAGHELGDFHYILDIENISLGEAAPDIIKNNLAVLFPETKERRLPDESVVKEIVANPDKFTFEKKKVSGQEVDYLPVRELNQDFYLAKEGKRVIFGNSLDELANYLVRLGRERGYYGKNIIDLSRDLAKWVASDFYGVVFGVNAEQRTK